MIMAILLAMRMYKKENELPDKIAGATGSFYRAVVKKLYIDEIYLFITQKIVFNLIGRPAAWFDKNIVDGLMNGMGYLTTATSTLIKGIQSGRIQNYALYFFGAIAGLAILFIYLWK